jgi:hypothetical protein
MAPDCGFIDMELGQGGAPKDRDCHSSPCCGGAVIAVSRVNVLTEAWITHCGAQQEPPQSTQIVVLSTAKKNRLFGEKKTTNFLVTFLPANMVVKLDWWR